MQFEEEEYKTIFRNSHLLALQAKEANENNETIQPMCVLGFTNAAIPVLMSGVASGGMNEACKKSITLVMRDLREGIEKELGEPLGPLLWLVIHGDVYVQAHEVPEDQGREATIQEILMGEHTPLEPLFKSGDTSVREAITTVGLYPGGQYHINHTYKWTLVDGYEWDDPHEFTEPGDDRWTFFNLAYQEEL